MVRRTAAVLVLVALGGSSACSKFEGVDETDAGAVQEAGAPEAGAEAGATTPYEAAVLADKPLVFWRFRGKASTIPDQGSALLPMSASSDLVLDKASLVKESNDFAIQMVVGGKLSSAATPKEWFSGTKAYAMECWFSITAAPKASDLLARGSVSNGISLSFDSGGALRAGRFANTLGTKVGSRTFLPNDVHHVVATFNGSRLSLYVDGKLDEAADDATPLVEGSLAITVGGPEGMTTRLESTTIDEIAFYDHALSQTAIEAHAKAGGLSL